MSEGQATGSPGHLNWISAEELARIKKEALTKRDKALLERIQRQERSSPNQPPYSIEWD